MSLYPTAVYLAVGDKVALSGGDYLPAGAYLNLLDPTRMLVQQDGLDLGEPPLPDGDPTAGAMPRAAALSLLPNRTITLDLLLTGNNLSAQADLNNSLWSNRRAIETLLEQARAATGPMGHGTGVCLLVRWATNGSAANVFTAYDILDGRMRENKGEYHNARFRRYALTLVCLPYGRMTAQTWPAVRTFSPTVANTYPSALYCGPTVPSWFGVSAPVATPVASLTTLYTNMIFDAGGQHAAAYLGTWDYGTFIADTMWPNVQGTAPNKRSVGPLPSFTGTKTLGVIAYSSPRVSTGMSVGAGTWSVAHALGSGGGYPNTTGQLTWAVYLVDGGTNALKTTIVAQTTFGPVVSMASQSPNNNWTGATGNATGAAYTAAASDYIVVEIGVTLVVSGSAQTPIVSLADSGNTSIANNASNTNPQSLVAGPMPPLPPTSTLYLDGATHPASAPSGALGSWTTTAGAALSTAGGSLVVNAPNHVSAHTFTNTATTQSNSISAAVAQYIGPTLAAGSYPSGVWELAAGFIQGAHSGTIAYVPHWAVYLVNGGTGAIRTTIVGAHDSITLESWLSLTTWRHSAAGVAYTASGGDYLVLEVGVTQSGPGTPQTYSTISVYDGGNAGIASGVSTSNASPKSFLTGPMTATAAPPPTGAFSASTLYGNAGGAPVSFVGLWSQTASGGALNRARLESTAQNGAAYDAVYAPASFAGSNTLATLALTSSPLPAQTIGAGTWSIGFGIAADTASGTTFTPEAGLYVINGATGAIRATVFARSTLGGARNADGTITAAFGTRSGSSAVVTAGDYLQLELGFFMTVSSGNVPGFVHVYGGGETTLNADGGDGADARVVLGAPAAVSLNADVVGSIPGDVGALVQIHVLDQSLPDFPISRIRVGRRAVPGAGGGMAESNWAGVVNTTTPLGPASLTTGDGDSVNGDFVTAAVSYATGTAPAWSSFARFIPPASDNGSFPLYEQGVYDVYVRLREHTLTVTEPPTITLLTATPALLGCPPDTYTFRAASTSGSATSAAGASAAITTTYPVTPDIFLSGFETGDTSDFLEISADGDSGGSGLTPTVAGSMAVQPQSALAGMYGLHIQGTWLFSDEQQGATSYVPTPFVRQVTRAFNRGALSGSAGCWMRLRGGVANDSYVVLVGLYSAAVEEANRQLAFGGTSTATYQESGKYGGLLAAVGIHNGEIGLLSWTTGAANPTFSSCGVFLDSLAGQLLWVGVGVVTTGAANTYNASASVRWNGAVYSASVSGATGPHAVSVALGPDSAAWGIWAAAGGGVLDMALDDCMIMASATVSAFQPGSTIALTLSGGVGGVSYVQQGTQEWFKQGSAGTLSMSDLNSTPADPPALASPLPALIRAQVGVAGTQFNPISSTPVETALQNATWHALYLGTLTLPPLQQFEGLNPAGGTGDGNFAWQLDIQVQPGTPATEYDVDIDALWLFPHDEPQIVAEFPGMTNNTLLEWVLDTRRDGRAGTLLRSAADQSTQAGSAITIGRMRLAPGNQSLIFLVEGPGGVHSVAKTQYALQIRFQAQVAELSDTATGY